MLIGTAQALYIGKLKTLLIKRNPKFCRIPYFEKSSKNFVNSTAQLSENPILTHIDRIQE